MANDEPVPVEQPTGAKGKKWKSAALVGIVMIAEGALIFVAMKYFAAPPAAARAEGDVSDEEGTASDARANMSEVQVAETDAVNDRTGRQYVFHIRVTAVTEVDKKEKLEKLIAERSATVLDRINTIIRSADPEHLKEPGLETIRRQIKFELNRIIGNESLVLELLIPQWLQSKSSL